MNIKTAIQSRCGELARLCARHRVKRLELFGSGAGNGFDSPSSDLDFLVTFEPMAPAEHADNFFGLQEDLEAIFERPADLVEPSSVRNPYFLKAIERARVVVYAT